MGQGNHIKLVWGMVDPSPELLGQLYTASDGADWRTAPSTGYESRNPWCGYTVAANGGVAERDEFDLERFAVLLDELPAYLERLAPTVIANARNKWDAWRALHPEFPEGRLLFVAEYD